MTIRTLLRKPFVNSRFAEPVDLTGKQAVVTGAGSGSLGYATARQLLQWGAKVTITTRANTQAVVNELTEELADPALTDNLSGHELDLSQRDSVKGFIDWFQGRSNGRLDILVNNAGVHLDVMGKLKSPDLTDDGFEIHWRINYLGTVDLTMGLMPLLFKAGEVSGEARVVNVGSQIHSRGSNVELFESHQPYNSWNAYGNSKLALIHFSNELDRRYGESHNLKSYCLHPGGKTGSYTNVSVRGLEGHSVMLNLKKILVPLEKVIMATAEEGAQTQLFCATAEEAASGNYYQNCAIAKVSSESLDQAVAARLWDDSMNWVKTG